MTTLLVPPVGPLTAARAYLLNELAARNNPLPVGVTPPVGQPTSYALLSRPGGRKREFVTDYLIRVRVYDANAVQLEDNTELLAALMLQPARKRIETEDGRSLWVTAATQSANPSSYDDDEAALFGMQFSVFWTIGLHPEVLNAGS
jgi:hypothetical protein